MMQRLVSLDGNAGSRLLLAPAILKAVRQDIDVFQGEKVDTNPVSCVFRFLTF
jgi:hypothetical protein